MNTSRGLVFSNKNSHNLRDEAGVCLFLTRKGEQCGHSTPLQRNKVLCLHHHIGRDGARVPDLVKLSTEGVFTTEMRPYINRARPREEEGQSIRESTTVTAQIHGLVGTRACWKTPTCGLRTIDSDPQRGARGALKSQKEKAGVWFGCMLDCPGWLSGKQAAGWCPRSQM